MAYFEILGISAKEILEIIVVILSFILLMEMAKLTLFFKKTKEKIKGGFFGLAAVSFLFLSMVSELVDSFYLEEIFDKLQLYTGIIAFGFLFIGFVIFFRNHSLRGSKND